MNTLICEAILQRKVIHFYYDGGYRIAEPHCYGVSKNSDELLRQTVRQLSPKKDTAQVSSE